MNELLWFVMFFLDYGLLLLLYRRYGRIGLFAWIPFATIIANLQVIKTIELFGLTATLGNIAYASIFLATDILSENYSRRDAVAAVGIGLFSMVAMAGIMLLATAFTPAPDDFAQPALKTIFSFVPRIVLGSLVAYAVSQLHDIWSYHFWKKRLPQTKFLWVRNNFSTIVSQVIDTLIFTTIAFAGVFETSIFWSIVITTFLLKAVVSLMDTPFIYLAKWLFVSKRVTEY
ncbi:MAG: queuosine precursor transporter [Lentisphaeria bacterium]|nr:queuosine precursor transporter [Lentisphaeria bacterium]